jgi:NAD(P)-dependent dehydrogenase (short-subunit alcohol dehydrogenase family)
VNSETRTAIVTGAGRGIGRAIAVALGGLGFRVTVNYIGNLTAADEAAFLVRQAGGEAVVVRADIAVADDRARLVEQALAAFGGIDLLVNNAGVAPRQRVDILDMTPQSFDHVIGANLKGAWFLTQAVARHMLATDVAENQRRRRAIVNIGSISAYAASVNRGEYCIAKAGLAMATKLFAVRLAEHGIGVHEVRPGIIATDMTAGVKEKYDRLIDDGLLPIRRWGQPEDVAAAVAAIAEGRLPYSTGQVIDVDGGFHLHRL